MKNNKDENKCQFARGIGIDWYKCVLTKGNCNCQRFCHDKQRFVFTNCVNGCKDYKKIVNKQ